MAKLNVTIPAVDVMVGAVTFRKVDRDARDGDIVRITQLSTPSYVIEGAFYKVESVDSVGDPQIEDEDGDEYDLGSTDYEVYEAVTEPSAETPLTYREVERQARAGETIKMTDDDGADGWAEGDMFVVAEIDWDGDARFTDNDGDSRCRGTDSYVVLEPIAEPIAPIAYVEVKRKAAVGERIRIVNTLDDRWVNGEEFPVMDAEYGGDVYVEHPEGMRSGDGYARVCTRQYVVLEAIGVKKAEEPARLSVGDYAKVIGPNDNFNTYEIGTVVQIAEDWTRENRIYTKARKADGQLGNYIRDYQLVPATEAEFLAQRKPAKTAQFKNGDYVKVTDASGAGNAKVGDIAVITNENWMGSGRVINVETLDGRKYGMFKERFTPATAEEVAEATAQIQRKAAIGPFADGGFAQITDASKSDSLSGFENGDYVKVRGVVEGVRKLRVATVRGNIGFCDADALRQITEAEYTEATAPKPTFNVGDYAKVTTDNHEHRVGDIVKITGTREDGGARWFDFGVERVSRGGNGYIDAKNIEKVSAEEAAAIEKERAETAKWAAIGRKVNEYKTGDIVEVVERGSSNYAVGLIDVVASADGGAITLTTGKTCPFINIKRVKLVTPVEQRFDNAA